MDFKIDPEVYLRLATVASALSPDNPKQILRCVRIEHLKGKAIAVASNAQFFCGELLGECVDDGAVNVTVDPGLIALAQAEMAVSGALVISQAPGWTVARGAETGQMFPMNAEVAGDYPAWRDLLPVEQPKTSNGVIAFFAASIKQIMDASPTGSIVFPSVIDITQPIIIRDKGYADWFGLYLLTDSKGEQSFKPATVPDWLK